MFILAFISISEAVTKQDRRLVLEKLTNYSRLSESGSMKLLKIRLESDAINNSQEGFIVVLSRPNREILHSTLPETWAASHLDESQYNRIITNPWKWQLIERNTEKSWIKRVEDYLFLTDKNAIEVISYKLNGGLYLLIGKTRVEQHEILKNFLWAFAMTAIPLILIGFVSGIFLTQKTMQPIREIVHTVKKVTAGSVESRVPEKSTGDELEELVNLFNEMLGRIETLIKGMRDALDNVGHDLRTPLTRMRGSVESGLQAEMDPHVLREALLDCAEESELISSVLNTLLDISEAETGVMHLNLAEVDLAPLVAETVEMYRFVAEEKNISLTLQVDSPVFIVADANRIRQVVANLLDNAIKYSLEYGQVTVIIRRENGDAVLVVKDTGTGIDPEALPNIFDRLYRGTDNRNLHGMGLGLSLVKAVINAHKGDISVQSRLGKGSEFIVRL